MVTITMPEWFAVAIAIYFGLDIIRMILNAINKQI